MGPRLAAYTYNTEYDGLPLPRNPFKSPNIAVFVFDTWFLISRYLFFWISVQKKNFNVFLKFR